MSTIVYYEGGFIESAPEQNMAEEWNDTTKTYAAWDINGDVTATRPYDTAELAALSAEQTALGLAANQSSLQAKASTALTASQTFLARLNPRSATPTYPLSVAEQETFVAAVEAIGAQVVALTRQVNALIYLQLQEFATTTGT